MTRDYQQEGPAFDDAATKWAPKQKPHNNMASGTLVAPTSTPWRNDRRTFLTPVVYPGVRIHCNHDRCALAEPATIPSGKQLQQQAQEDIRAAEADVYGPSMVKDVLDEIVERVEAQYIDERERLSFADDVEETRALIAEHPELEEFFTQRLDKIGKDYDIFALADLRSDLRSDLERTRDFYETTDWELERLIDKLEISPCLRWDLRQRKHRQLHDWRPGDSRQPNSWV
eukprot:COSAG02_NODE_3969_length_5974_cov_1.685957_2_plen_229_part_00